MSKPFYYAVLITGFLVGTLDALAAILNFIVPVIRNPVIIFRYIASGLFGKSAYSDGVIMPLTGLLFHYFIATAWTLLFFAAYPRLSWLRKNKIMVGIAYGIVVWLAMNLMVVPLSLAAQFPFRPLQAAVGMAILIVVVGLPISIRAHRYFSNRDLTNYENYFE